MQHNAQQGAHHTTTVSGHGNYMSGPKYDHHTSVINVPQVRMDIYGTPAHGNPNVARDTKMSELKSIADNVGLVKH